MYFAISGKDFSENVQTSTYEINKIPEFDEWVSADRKYHKDLARTRIQGSFDMVFISDNSQDYLEFISYVNRNAYDNRIACDLYIGNTGAVESNISCYYTIEYKSRTHTNGNTYVDRISITLEEK